MQKAAYAYLATQVTTTDQGALLLLLYEGAIKFLKQAKAKIEERDYAQKGMLISKALDVIAELDSSLNAEKGGELAQNLHNLYFYCNTRLLQANLRMNTAQIDEVIRILEALKEAFNQISTSKFPTKAASVHAPGGAAGDGAASAGAGGKAQVFSIGKSSGPAPAAHVLAAAAQAAAAAPPPSYKPTPAARPTPVARPVPAAPAAPSPAPVAALKKPAASAQPAAAAAAPAATAPADPAPQPAAPENPDLVRVKALHRAYGRYGSS